MANRAALAVLLGSLIVGCGGGEGGDAPDGGSPPPPDGAAAVDAPSRVTVSGVTQTAQGTSIVPLAGVTVDALLRAGGSVVGSATSSASGEYAIMLDTPGAAGLDVYFRARSSGRVDSYLYPPRPVTADTGGVTLLVVPSSTLSQLSSVGGVTYDASRGFVALIVADAAGTPVAGASVSVTPTGSARVLYARGMFPSGSATSTDTSGTVFIPNTNTGSLTVDATGGGADYQAVTLEARAGALTSTLLIP